MSPLKPTGDIFLSYVQIHTSSAKLISLCSGFPSRMRFVYKDFGRALGSIRKKIEEERYPGDRRKIG